MSKKLKNHFPLIHCNLNLLKNTWNKFLFDNELFFLSIKCFTNVWIWKKKKCRRFDYDLNLCLATFILHVRRPPEKYWHQISVFLTVNSTFIYFSHVIRVWSKMQHFISHSLEQRRLDCIRTARAGWTTFVVALIMTVLQLSVKTRWIFCSIISPTERMKDVHHFEKSWWEVFAIYP